MKSLHYDKNLVHEFGLANKIYDTLRNNPDREYLELSAIERYENTKWEDIYQKKSKVIL